MKHMLVLLFALLLASCAPGVVAYHHGNHAYQQGDYHTSFAYYLYAAEQGVVPAQYAVAYQYFYGQGAKRDETQAIRWLQRAAPFSPRARYALHLIRESVPRQPWAFKLKAS